MKAEKRLGLAYVEVITTDESGNETREFVDINDLEQEEHEEFLRAMKMQIRLYEIIVKQEELKIT